MDNSNDKPIRVRILKCSSPAAWYLYYVGESFEVKAHSDTQWVTINGTPNFNCPAFIDKSDCTILPESDEKGNDFVITTDGGIDGVVIYEKKDKPMTADMVFSEKEIKDLILGWNANENSFGYITEYLNKKATALLLARDLEIERLRKELEEAKKEVERLNRKIETDDCMHFFESKSTTGGTEKKCLVCGFVQVIPPTF